MAIKQPNTICKNKDCHKGKDGGKKIFYSCHYCINQATWRSMCCSEDCYLQYMKQVAEARSNSESISLFPERTDMTSEEVKDIVQNESVEDAIAITKEELKDEFEENPGASIAEVVKKVNKKIDKERGV